MMLGSGESDAEILRQLYLGALSRSPASKTENDYLTYIINSTDRRQAWEDILWTILNSQEFVYQH